MHSETFRLLAVLASGPSTSGDLLDRIAAVSRGDAPSLATFYRRLKEAVDLGWVVATVPDEERSVPGRPPRLFRITDVGLRAARVEAERQRAFADLLPRGEGATG